jgi:hypothetical protein
MPKPLPCAAALGAGSAEGCKVGYTSSRTKNEPRAGVLPLARVCAWRASGVALTASTFLRSPLLASSCQVAADSNGHNEDAKLLPRSKSREQLAEEAREAASSSNAQAHPDVSSPAREALARCVSVRQWQRGGDHQAAPTLPLTLSSSHRGASALGGEDVTRNLSRSHQCRRRRRAT